MEYNCCYALNNYYRRNMNEEVNINNIEIKRTFLNIKSETGFIKVHIAINQHSGVLVQAGLNVLTSCAENNRKEFNTNLNLMRDTLNFMN